MSNAHDVFCDVLFARRIIAGEEYAIREASEVLEDYLMPLVRNQCGGGNSSRYINIYAEDLVHDMVLRIVRSPETFWAGVASGEYQSNKGYLNAACRKYLSSAYRNERWLTPDASHPDPGLPKGKSSGKDILFTASGIFYERAGLSHEVVFADPSLLGQCIVKTMRTCAAALAQRTKRVSYLAVALLNARIIIVKHSLSTNPDVVQPQSAVQDAETLVPWERNDYPLRIPDSKGKTLEAVWDECTHRLGKGEAADGYLACRTMAIERAYFDAINARWRKTVIEYGEKTPEKSPCWLSVSCIFGLQKNRSGRT